MTDRISLAEKYELMRPHLNERQWRLYLGVDALEYGVPVVTQASGASKNTVRKGMNEIETGAEVTDRVRAPGAGRPDLETVQPGITAALESLVATKGAASLDELQRTAQAWDHAADRTPHGQPIELRPEDFRP